ncbi:hypothetical protein KCP75_16610 [Salmonella enterica subsp. enterica]|nr:hypothetical protein KCP75_16610 [Salmonella enterica subsp. enterica]
MDVKSAAARYDCARPAVAREYASEAGGDESALSPGPMNTNISREVLSLAGLGEERHVLKCQLAQQDRLTAGRAHASTVTPAHSVARWRQRGTVLVGWHAADNTRVMVDGKPIPSASCLSRGGDSGHCRLIFYRSLSGCNDGETAGAHPSTFQRIAQERLSQPIEALGRNCVGRFGACHARDARDGLREAMARYDPRRKRQYLARRDEILPVITMRNRPLRWKDGP